MSPFNRAAWYGTAPLTEVGRTMVADARMLEVGWLAWNCPIALADEHALGGVIDAIYDRELFDHETGEIETVRFFHCLNYFKPVDHARFAHTLVGGEIQLPDGTAPPDRRLINGLVKKMWSRCATPGFITRTELDLAESAMRLLAVIR